MYALNLIVKGVTIPRLLLGLSLAMSTVAGASAMPEPQTKATVGQVTASGVVEDTSGLR